MIKNETRIYGDPGLLRIEHRKRKVRIRVGLDPAVYVDLRDRQLAELIEALGYEINERPE